MSYTPTDMLNDAGFLICMAGPFRFEVRHESSGDCHAVIETNRSPLDMAIMAFLAGRTSAKALTE